MIHSIVIRFRLLSLYNVKGTTFDPIVEIYNILFDIKEIFELLPPFFWLVTMTLMMMMMTIVIEWTLVHIYLLFVA